MGYDFHLGAQGPQLIEINTNAGGAFLNAVLARAQRACCATAAARTARTSLPDDFEAAVGRMFEDEWRRQRGSAPLRLVAIADDAPREQYLYPEFVLAQRMLSRRGWEVEIVDAAEFRHQDGRLTAGGHAFDLVDNRVTDFAPVPICAS